jgi:hypothetical protein
MKLIKADHDRRLELPGVPGPVRRPVDIDRSRTGFANLRSLRIYQFDAHSVINGHAEEDEVFVIVMAGSVEFSVREANAEGEALSLTLSAVSESSNDACVAYLSPHSAYQLTPRTDAHVAYARATPVSSRPSIVFASGVSRDAAGMTVLLKETAYAQRLRLRLAQIDAREDDISFTPVEELESCYEALVHIQTVPAERVATVTTGTESTQLHSWDTIAVAPEDRPTLSIAKGSSALVLIVWAG